MAGLQSIRRLKKEDYTVGWICALPVPEWQASRLMLDEEHEDVPLGTQYQYAFGSMNGHNVVMGCLPDTVMGIGAAASVASEMRSIFPHLRFGLLVGVGGGVPNEASDIRLCDVVVSRPDPAQRHGGVKQYDFGKAIHDGKFQPTGLLGMPPDILLSALGKVRSAPPSGSRFDAYLQSFIQWREDSPEFSAPPTSDRLFQADYAHPSKEPTCRKCDPQRELARGARADTRPQVHYGTIASGNQVIKDAKKRDELSEELGGVLCFEMEAAGLVNHFPCLVVRGICDYCDSHKNKKCQPYAAAAAAAWAKELLRNIAPAEVDKRDTILQLSKEVMPRTLNMLIGLFDPDQDFVDREAVFRAIHNVVSDPEAHSRVALVGLGGIGKSQIAIEYGWRIQQSRNDMSIFWVYASSPERFKNDYQSIATHARLPGFDDPRQDHLSKVTKWLKSEESGKWLLILDNADDKDFAAGWVGELPKTPKFTIHEHLPRKRGCTVLVTSRDRQAAFSLVDREGNIVEVSSMTEPEAVQLFQNKTGTRSWDVVQATRLATQLDCIPLAITQAAAYIMQRTRMTIAAYLELFQQDEERQLLQNQNDSRRDINVPHAIIKTWEISFRHIQSQIAKAAELLYCLSFLDKQRIPTWLLRDGKSTRLVFNEAMETLRRFSFIDWPLKDDTGLADSLALASVDGEEFEDNEILNMHRLVQVATRSWLRTQGELERWSGVVLKLVQSKYPDKGIRAWKTCQLLEPHAEAAIEHSYTFWTNTERLCATSSGGLWNEIQAKQARGVLLYNRAMFAHEQERFTKAVEMAKNGLKDLRDATGEEDQAVLRCGSVLAVSYLDAGHLEEAANVGTSVFESQRDLLGLEDWDTLTTLDNLAMTYRKLGQHEQAKEMLLDIMKISSGLSADGEKTLLATINDFAGMLGAEGHWKMKEALELEAVHKFMDTEGDFHPQTLTMMSNLAHTYHMQGRFDQAEDLLAKVTNNMKYTHPPEHPATISRLGALANVYYFQGRSADACDLQRTVYETSKRFRGDTDPATAAQLFNLVTYLRSMGQHLEATDLLEDCAASFAAKKGEHHLLTQQIWSLLYEFGDEDSGPAFLETGPSKAVPDIRSLHDGRESCLRILEALHWAESEEDADVPDPFEVSDDDRFG